MNVHFFEGGSQFRAVQGRTHDQFETIRHLVPYGHGSHRSLFCTQKSSSSWPDGWYSSRTEIRRKN